MTKAPQVPVLAVCGYSGSGKTTLVEKLLPLLSGRGLKVAVLKHDAHHLTVDRPGKDTARFFDAGAAVVLAHDDEEGFMRFRKPVDFKYENMIELPPFDCDLVLVEGHKLSPWPKVWLTGEPPKPPPEEAKVIIEVMTRTDDLAERMEKVALEYMEDFSRP